jgi:HEAT repeat protein
MTRLSVLVASLPPTEQPWFWTAADITVGVLLALNVLLLVGVHARALRHRLRERRRERFRVRLGEIMAELESNEPDLAKLRAQLGLFDELERPIAAELLIDRVRAESAEERTHTLTILREIGAVDRLLGSTRSARPWRRALAIRTLGLLRAEEALPVLIVRLSDRSRYVREAAVRALGRIGDTRAVPALAELFAKPGSVAAGLVYQALAAFGEQAGPVFREGVRSPNELVRIASVFGIASAYEPAQTGEQLEDLLADESAAVRAAAAEMLGRIGGEHVPSELARSLRDEQRSVRRAAVSALGSYDDSEAVRLALGALDDPDRDTALRAGETLVRLGRLPNVGAEARAAVAETLSWSVETARVAASLEAR